MRPMSARILEMAGQDFEQTRAGKVLATIRGIPDTDDVGGYIGFPPEVDVAEHDSLKGTISKAIHQVKEIRNTIIDNKIWQIRVYHHLKEETTKASTIIQVGTMTSSGIQVGSPGATQTLNFQHQTASELRDLISQVLSKLEELGLNDKQKAELKGQAATIEAQLGVENPKKVVIAICLDAIKELIVHGITAGTSVAGSLVLGQVTNAIAFWSS